MLSCGTHAWRSHGGPLATPFGHADWESGSLSPVGLAVIVEYLIRKLDLYLVMLRRSSEFLLE